MQQEEEDLSKELAGVLNEFRTLEDVQEDWQRRRDNPARRKYARYIRATLNRGYHYAVRVMLLEVRPTLTTIPPTTLLWFNRSATDQQLREAVVRRTRSTRSSLARQRTECSCTRAGSAPTSATPRSPPLSAAAGARVRMGCPRRAQVVSACGTRMPLAPPCTRSPMAGSRCRWTGGTCRSTPSSRRATPSALIP